MVDPNHVAVVECDGIATPDIFGVEVRDGNVSAVDYDLVRAYLTESSRHDLLDDDVACTANDPQTFALDHTAGSRADQTLVGFEIGRAHV